MDASEYFERVRRAFFKQRALCGAYEEKVESADGMAARPERGSSIRDDSRIAREIADVEDAHDKWKDAEEQYKTLRSEAEGVLDQFDRDYSRYWMASAVMRDYYLYGRHISAIGRGLGYSESTVKRVKAEALALLQPYIPIC